jgi:hypothetical protein
MDADWSVELGRDDPALEFPWASPDGSHGYVDLSTDNAGLNKIPEAVQYPPLLSFLIGLNAKSSPCLSVKCDAWIDNEVDDDMKLDGARWRMASYVDVIRRDASQRFSLEQHERWVKAAVARLRLFPDAPYVCELIVRRCYYHLEGRPGESSPGFYITVYVFGYGEQQIHAQSQWKGGLDRVHHALGQLDW